ncbi:metal ABC transporter substrate-binding protein [Aquisalibacillus elongatus]|uniref:Zinc transport system substrate-binding protein n=1 Tax=Aquisalibacillus elongatus TaxID=485577 RepID=A0A3N5AZI2_9BACI|nr:zinc ABC transporter substrate-binding protein [Aquisalibacillus elongatus]RPF50363.1 zinc transport system substrate-binding protein [Aquisalibacillus elongatus]
MKLVKLFSMLFFLSFLWACQANDSNSNEENTIYTSIYPIEYIASEIAGDHVQVNTVVPSGADAHSYEPSTKTMIELSSSDAFYFVGEGMESFSETMAESVQSEDVHILRLAEYEQLFEDFTQDEGLINQSSESNQEDEDEHEHEEDDHFDEDNHQEEETHENDAEDDHAHGDFDPHFWLDPIRMIDAGEIVLDDLIQLYPEQEEAFRENFEAYKNKMNELDEEYNNQLDQEVSILVTHKSFSYMEERYPIKQHSIRGVSASQEPSQRELQQLFEQIEELGIDSIVFEENSDDRLAQTIANELNLTKYYLNNLSTRTEDNVKQDKDYYDIMIDNLNVLNEIQP